MDHSPPILSPLDPAGPLTAARLRRLALPHGGLRVSERKLLLAAVDLALLNGALLLTEVVRGQLPATLSAAWGRLPWFLILTVLWVHVAFLFDAYNLATAASRLRSLWAAGGAAALTGAVYLLIPFLTPVFPGRRRELLLFPALAVAAVGAWRVVYATVFVQPLFRQTVLIVGAGTAGRTLARDIDPAAGLAPATGPPPVAGQAPPAAAGAAGAPVDAPEVPAACPMTGYCVLGYIDDDPALQGGRVEGIPVLGGRGDLVRLARALRPDELLVAICDLDHVHVKLFEAILDCWEMGICVRTMQEFYERKTGRVPVEYVGRNLHLVLPPDHGPAYRLYVSLWRAFELLAAALGCAATALVAPLIWLANRLTDSGDLFFWQERVGAGGKTFRIVKFRSMVMDAEKYSGAVWAEEDDPRITPLGRFLRKTRLDELPQFWNVLVGEMALIGPRPERPEFVCQLTKQLPFYRARHAIKPGLTGWAQVCYRYGASVEDALVKLQHDLFYIKHRGPYIDLQIVIKTVQVMVTMRGH